MNYNRFFAIHFKSWLYTVHMGLTCLVVITTGWLLLVVLALFWPFALFLQRLGYDVVALITTPINPPKQAVDTELWQDSWEGEDRLNKM